jgi:hypothetical protein
VDSLLQAAVKEALTGHQLVPGRRGQRARLRLGTHSVLLSDGSVKNGFDSAILTKIPRVKKEERAGSAADD